MFQHVFQLAAEGAPKIIVGREVPRITGVHTDPVVPVGFHHAVLQGHLNDRPQVDPGTSGRDRIPVEHLRFRAAADAVVVRLFDLCALGEEQGDDLLIEEELRKPCPLLDRLGDGVEERFRRLRMDPGRQVRVVQGELPLGFEHQVGQLVRDVLSVLVYTPEGGRLPVGVPVRVRKIPGCRVDIHILGHAYPQALEQFHGLVLRDSTLFDVFLEEGIEVLIDPAVADRSADALFESGDGLDEPL